MTAVIRPNIDIAFGIDTPYLPHLGVAIHSIIRHTPDLRFRFIVLHAGLSEERKRLLESVGPNARFHWAEVSNDDVPRYADTAHFSRAILFRLGLENLAPADCHRVLYLDTDVIALGNVRDVWEFDLEGAPIGAATDSYYLDGTEFARKWGLPPNALGYFNSGMMLIDLEQVRAKGLFSAAIEVVARRGAGLRFADQDALNIVMWGQWRRLPPCWNAQRDMVIPSLAKRLPEELQFHSRLPDLVHFTGPEKPWVTNGYHPWSWLYWDNLPHTPFFDEVVRKESMGWLKRLRLWIRWLCRRPRAGMRVHRLSSAGESLHRPVTAARPRQ